MGTYDTKRRGGRPRTGSVEPAGSWPSGAPRYRFRLRLADGTKSERYDVPEGHDLASAQALVAGFQAEEDVQHVSLAKKQSAARAKAREAHVAIDGETASAWHERFLASRGDTKRSDSGYRWNKWVHPHIGDLPMMSVTRADIERVRDALDNAIAAHRELGRGKGRLAPKAALNVWAVVTTAFKHACQAKQRDLRVRDDNPCANVLPPERGDSRRKEWIYPKEFAALAACDDVPIEWRELYAIACYLYLRPGELFELRWKDVDLSMGDVHVTRAWEWMERKVKTPKTRNGVRHVPIPSTLLPLLKRMGQGAAPEAKVVPVLEATGKERKTSEMMREHLRRAGVTHGRLYADNATHMPIGFRSWRDTGITWLALAGTDVVKMQRRAGHDTIETTMGYVKAAEDISGAAGTPFPELPANLVWPNRWPSRSRPLGISQGPEVPAQGFEPR